METYSLFIGWKTQYFIMSVSTLTKSIIYSMQFQSRSRHIFFAEINTLALKLHWKFKKYRLFQAILKKLNDLHYLTYCRTENKVIADMKISK